MAVQARKVASATLTLMGALLIAFVAYLWSVAGSDATTPAIIFGVLAAGLFVAAKAVSR